MRRMVMRICERCRNVPDFYQREAFLIFAPLLLWSNQFFLTGWAFWISVASLCLLRFREVTPSRWEHCDVTVFSMMRSKTSGQKKVEFFLVKLLFPSAGPAKKKPPGIPGYSIVIKTFFSWYPCSPCGVKFKYCDQFVEQYSYALRGRAWPKWLLSGIGAINTTSQCHSQARRLLS